MNIHTHMRLEKYNVDNNTHNTNIKCTTHPEHNSLYVSRVRGAIA